MESEGSLRIDFQGEMAFYKSNWEARHCNEQFFNHVQKGDILSLFKFR
jgi:hypothetical protein